MIAVSVLLSIMYLIFYNSLSPILSFILSITMIVFMGLSYVKDDDDHRVKISLLCLILAVVLIPRLFLSPDASLMYKVIWTVITFALIGKELLKEIQAIKTVE